jgi:hypothetical protein
MNRKLNFTEEGYLTPIEGIESDLEIIKTTFVDEFPNSKTRRRLFENYLEYLRQFSRNITPQFEQWINGSFVTQKVNPNDIDFVTFIDGSTFLRYEKELESFWSFSLEDEGLDAYIVKIYPTDSLLFLAHTEHFKNVWLKRYCRTKADAQLDISKKGFIKLKIGNL